MITVRDNPTTPLWNEEFFRPFNRWMNNLRHGELNPQRYRFSFTDIDGVLFQLNDPMIALFLLEVKTHGKQDLRWSQATIFPFLDAIFLAAHGQDIPYMAHGGPRRARLAYLGWHCLCLDTDSPETAQQILWNGQPVSLHELIEMLRFQRNPISRQLVNGAGQGASQKGYQHD